MDNLFIHDNLVVVVVPVAAVTVCCWLTCNSYHTHRVRVREREGVRETV